MEINVLNYTNATQLWKYEDVGGERLTYVVRQSTVAGVVHNFEVTCVTPIEELQDLCLNFVVGVFRGYEPYLNPIPIVANESLCQLIYL